MACSFPAVSPVPVSAPAATACPAGPGHVVDLRTLESAVVRIGPSLRP